ncbi:hypothetical protein MD484_g6698, partial [Candolleomyces efflorescens]
MFDGHFYIPGCEDSLAALRYFNKGEPLLTPYAYFVNAQTLPSGSAGESEDSRCIIAKGTKPSDYQFIGDVRDLIPFGPVDPTTIEDGEAIVDPRIPPYVFTSGAVDDVQVTADCITFRLNVDQYIGPLEGKASVVLRCSINFGKSAGSLRWSFLANDPAKRRSFIRKGGYVSVEGRLDGTETINDERGEQSVALHLSVEEVTLLGRVPMPSVDLIEISDDSPLRSKRKAGDADPTTPCRFSYSSLPDAKSKGKIRRIEGRRPLKETSVSNLESSPMPSNSSQDPFYESS